MLDYTAIIQDPYPDVQDPVTGEWLPKSANQIRADVRARQAQARQSASNSQMLNMFKSIMK